MNKLQDKCNEIIDTLIKKYEGNEYMTQRVYSHIINYLPNTLDNEFINYEKRINRNAYLTNEQQLFIQIFLSKNKYYYLHNNNFFYEYDGERYLIVKEDDIIHKLLSSISKDRILMQWKYKTKMNVIKLIKDRSLFTSIPETDTIQNILNFLYPSIFETKNTAKYFLTIIGDNIFKKNSNLIFLVSPKMKKILIELDNVALSSIGCNYSTNNFMTKYHENHSYENCRLIKINEKISVEYWRDILKKIGLDLLCVATHYSKRYENSDKFIENKLDGTLISYSYYLKNSNQINIINDFCSKYIVDANDNMNIQNIEWKNLHFLWKQFLSNSCLPNIIYANSLKQLFKNKYNYNEENDEFIGITSKFLPIQSDFIKFWDNTITTIQHEENAEALFDNDFEIDEICSLFKIWSKENNLAIKNYNIDEDNVLKILKHFYPSIEIIDDRFVLNIKSIIWDKNSDINISFQYIKERSLMNNLTLVSIDDAYSYYYKYCKLNDFKLIVNKRYFEKYLYFKLNNHIIYEKIIQINLL
jgi:hypothetical protein